MPQVDALCEYLSLVLCQASFNIPWTSIIPKTEDLTQVESMLIYVLSVHNQAMYSVFSPSKYI